MGAVRALWLSTAPITVQLALLYAETPHVVWSRPVSSSPSGTTAAWNVSHYAPGRLLSFIAN